MLELKLTISEIKIHHDSLVAECQRQMKMSKNLMIYQWNLFHFKNKGGGER